MAEIEKMRKARDESSGRRRRAILFTAALASVGLVSKAAGAAITGTWIGGTATSWETAANWGAGVAPGSSTAANNPDSAVFNIATNTSVVLTAQRFFGGNIVFDTPNAGAFTLSGTGALRPEDNSSTGSSPVIESTGTVNNPQTISNQVTVGVQPSGGTGSFTVSSNAAAPSNVMTLSGSILNSSSQIVVLTGANTGNNTVSGVMGSSMTSVGVTKAGDGTWVLNNSNFFFPNGPRVLALSDGNLIFDYSIVTSVAKNPILPVFGGGTLTIKANSSGMTAQSLGTVTFNANSFSTIVVNKNGGTSANLSVGTWTTNAGDTLLVDLSSGGTLTSSPALINGLAVGTGANAFAVVKDNTLATGFATVSGGKVVRYTATTALPASPISGGDSTVNYSGANTSVTLGGAMASNTVQLDASISPTALDLNGNDLTLTSNAILFTGSNNVTVSNSASPGVLGGGASTSLYLHNYNTATVTISAPLSNATGATYYVAGSGLTQIATDTGVNAVLEGGITRYTNGATGGSGNLMVTGSGILEIGTNMSGGAVDFNRAVGTGDGSIQFGTNAGFSAFGANRVVNLGGGSASLTWGAANTWTDNLVLSSSQSNGMVELQNGINLGADTRTVVVNHGSAAVDARLSGVISGTTTAGLSGELVKSGPGVLELTGNNTYPGGTAVGAGKLLVNNATGSGLGAGPVLVAGGTLAGTGSFTGAVTVSSAGTVTAGVGSGASTLTTGAVTFADGAQFTVALNSDSATTDRLTSTGAVSLGDGTSSFALLNVSDLGSTIAASPQTYVILSANSPIAGVFKNLADSMILSDNSTLTVGNNQYTINYDNDDVTLTSVVPEPGSLALLGLGSFGLLGRRRRGLRRSSST